MSDKTATLEKREAETVDTVERTRARKTFVPPVDIFETKDGITLVADMPGVDEKAINITLEKNVLTVTGRVEPEEPEGYSLVYTEYETGDYQRSFTLTDEVDSNRIEASVKNGVLKVSLPKAEKARSRKIEVKVGS